MGQLDFWGTYEDSIDILQDLIRSHRFSFVVDMSYTEPIPVIFKELDDRVLDLLKTRNSLFLFSENYSIYPPYFLQYKDGSMDIRLNRCGPGMCMNIMTIHQTQGVLGLGLGSLFLPPRFYHPVTGASYRISDEMRKEFYFARNTVLKHSKKRYFAANDGIQESPSQSKIFPIWLGLHGLKLFERGEVSVFAHGKQLSLTRDNCRSD